MNLNLQDSWFDLCVAHDLSDLGSANVAETDVAHESLFDQCFHCLPSLLVCHSLVKDHPWFALVNFVIEVDPFRWVQLIDRNVSQRDWEMNQVQVQVINT